MLLSVCSILNMSWREGEGRLTFLIIESSVTSVFTWLNSQGSVQQTSYFGVCNSCLLHLHVYECWSTGVSDFTWHCADWSVWGLTQWVQVKNFVHLETTPMTHHFDDAMKVWEQSAGGSFSTVCDQIKSNSRWKTWLIEDDISCCSYFQKMTSLPKYIILTQLSSKNKILFHIAIIRAKMIFSGSRHKYRTT